MFLVYRRFVFLSRKIIICRTACIVVDFWSLLISLLVRKMIKVGQNFFCHLLSAVLLLSWNQDNSGAHTEWSTMCGKLFNHYAKIAMLHAT